MRISRRWRKSARGIRGARTPRWGHRSIRTIFIPEPREFAGLLQEQHEGTGCARGMREQIEGMLWRAPNWWRVWGRHDKSCAGECRRGIQTAAGRGVLRKDADPD